MAQWPFLSNYETESGPDMKQNISDTNSLLSNASYSIERLRYTLIGYWWLYVAHDWFFVATLDDAVTSLQWQHPERWFTNFYVKVLEKCEFRLISSLFVRVVILTTKKTYKICHVTSARVFPLWQSEYTVNQILHIL